jgi:molybdate transport system substrate-binding protein
VENPDVGWLHDWSVGVRVWAERAGRAVFGPDRLELLEEIDRCHSISAAARQTGVSYRHAWVLVQRINEAAGEPLVEAAPGGTSGGGARLTPHGRLAVAIFRELQEQVRHTAAGLLPRLVPRSATAPLHVAAAVSLEEVLGQLLTDYALRQPAVRVRVIYGASDELADQVLGGARADVFLTAEPGQLRRLRGLGTTTPVALAENTLAAIAPADRPVPVRKAADLLRPAINRVALAVPSSPLGGYTRAYLERLNLYTALLPRAVLLENARTVVAAVQAGQADAGLVYSSAISSAAGCRILFRVRRPPAAIRYVGAVVGKGQAQQAHDLLAFLTSPAAAQRFRRCGFLPARLPKKRRKGARSASKGSR